MATRSRIAIQNEDGTVTSIYCHWDGYPENNGNILVSHFKNRDKVKKLIALGSLSSLAPEIEAPEGHTFSDPAEGHTVAYSRDRGESLDISHHMDADSYFSGDIEEYGYLYTLEGDWIVKSEDFVKPEKVTSILEKK
jgi:hypothetical protein